MNSAHKSHVIRHILAMAVLVGIFASAWFGWRATTKCPSDAAASPAPAKTPPAASAKRAPRPAGDGAVAIKAPPRGNKYLHGAVQAKPRPAVSFGRNFGQAVQSGLRWAAGTVWRACCALESSFRARSQPGQGDSSAPAQLAKAAAAPSSPAGPGSPAPAGRVDPASPGRSPTLPRQSAAPPKTSPASFKLTGIIRSSDGDLAVINGRAVKVGDVVDGATVVGIHRYGVELQVGAERFAIRM